MFITSTISIDVQCDNNLRYSELFRNFRKANNYEGINADLYDVDWSDIFNCTDCESKLKKILFYLK